jgi:hypothetical protein
MACPGLSPIRGRERGSMTETLDSQLDEIRAMMRDTAPFDISPRGIRVRPGEAMLAKIDAFVAQGEVAQETLVKRLNQEADPFALLIWLYSLKQFQSPGAEAAIEAFAQRLERGAILENEFPGKREILLFLGRNP